MTDAYKEWLGEVEREVTDMFTNMPPGHPFAGQLSVTDMKLRLAQYVFHHSNFCIMVFFL